MGEKISRLRHSFFELEVRKRINEAREREIREVNLALRGKRKMEEAVKYDLKKSVPLQVSTLRPFQVFNN